jgi:hypothetical protein
VSDRNRLSTQGSDRATAYNISNKILRCDDALLVGWLDGPATEGAPVRIRLGICDPRSGALQKVVPLGEGVDNHCGPALALGAEGRVHALVGAHHGEFLYRYSDNPADPTSWSAPQALGPCHSYPAFVIDADGVFHLAYREKAQRWQLHYTRKRPGAAWEPPTAIAQSPTPGYNHFMHSLSVGPSGRLHMTFQFHFSESGVNLDCLTKGMTHIESDDGGDTWRNLGEPCALPLTVDNTRWISECFADPAASMRIGTHVVDRNDRAWLFASLPHPDRGVMWRQTDDGWDNIDLSQVAPGLALGGGKATAISYDSSDRIHLLLSTDPEGKIPGWYDPALELFHLVFSLDGRLESCKQVSETNPTRAHWLPAIEHWDWCNRRDIGEDGHWYAYTDGNNAGLMNQTGYDDVLRTDVRLGRL